jgi:hypothetical protein
MRFTLIVLMLILGVSLLRAQSLRSELAVPLDTNIPFRLTFDEQLLEKPEVVSRGNVWIMEGDNQRYDHTHLMNGRHFRQLAVRTANDMRSLLDGTASGDSPSGTILTINENNSLLSYVNPMTLTFGTSISEVTTVLESFQATGVTQQINGVETREFANSGFRVYLDAVGVIHRMETFHRKAWKVSAEATAFATVGTKRYPSQWKTDRSLITITQIETNPEIAPETFTMTYPPGAEVMDWRNGHFALRANSRGELEIDWFRSHTIQVWALWVGGVVTVLVGGWWLVRTVRKRRAKVDAKAV